MDKNLTFDELKNGSSDKKNCVGGRIELRNFHLEANLRHVMNDLMNNPSALLIKAN